MNRTGPGTASGMYTLERFTDGAASGTIFDFTKKDLRMLD